MTKKSLSRKMRDEQAASNAAKEKEIEHYLNNNTIFDDLNEIRNSIAGFIQMFSSIGNLTSRDDLTAFLVNPGSTKESIQVLTSDLRMIVRDFKMIADLHKDKTGGARTPDDHMHALSMGQAYEQMRSLIEGNALPLYGKIMEDFVVAEKKLLEQQKTQTETTPA